MPTWVKVIIALTIIGFIGFIAMIVFGVVFFKENFGPEHATKVSNKMMDLEEPLPHGWKYGVGLDVGYQSIVNFKNTDLNRTNMLVQFTKTTPHGRGRSSAKAIASKFNMPSAGGMKFEVDDRGEQQIGGQKAYYVREHGSVFGRKSALEVSLIDLPDNGMMQIQTTEEGLSSFDPELVKPLFDHIKSFAPKTP